MNDKRFNPNTFIDRQFEQEIFANLLARTDSARVLTVRDAGGMGKSHLLEKFQHRCTTNRPERIPVSLVKLDQLPDPSPLALIKQIVQHLARFEVATPRFTHHDNLRMSADFHSIRASVYLRSRTFGTKRGARERYDTATLRLTMVEILSDSDLRDLYFDLDVDYDNLSGQNKRDKVRELISHLQRSKRLPELLTLCNRLFPHADWQAVENRSQELYEAELLPFMSDWDDSPGLGESNNKPLTPEQEQTALDVSFRAFFDDINEICADQQVVLMLDTYERCPPALRDWIEEQLLERFVFHAKPPQHLLLVLGGRDIPNFQHRWPHEECEALVRSVKGLGKWQREDVADCLRVYGYDDYEEQDVDTFHRLIMLGIAPSEVVGLIQIAAANRRSAA
jgi:hypothetical protein